MSAGKAIVAINSFELSLQLKCLLPQRLSALQAPAPVPAEDCRTHHEQNKEVLELDVKFLRHSRQAAVPHCN
jgi:hypothetical protein